MEHALKALEEAVRQYNLAANSLALIPVSAKRADGAEYEINLDRNSAAPTGLVNIDLKVMIPKRVLIPVTSHAGGDVEYSYDYNASGHSLAGLRKRAPYRT